MRMSKRGIPIIEDHEAISREGGTHRIIERPTRAASKLEKQWPGQRTKATDAALEAQAEKDHMEGACQ